MLPLTVQRSPLSIHRSAGDAEVGYPLGAGGSDLVEEMKVLLASIVFYLLWWPVLLYALAFAASSNLQASVLPGYESGGYRNSWGGVVQQSYVHV